MKRPLVLVRKLTDNILEVLTPFSNSLECPKGFDLRSLNDGGLQGHLYHLEGPLKETITLTLMGRETHAITFQL